MDQLASLGSGSDFPLSTAWDWTDPNLSLENPGNHQCLKPTDLGGLRNPQELRKWGGIGKPVTSLTTQVLEETLLSILSGGKGGQHNPKPPTLH